MCAVPQGANPLAGMIRAKIDDDGPMPFARCMELALYHPEFGYYEKEASQVGRQGDFVTSVSVGAAFGQLLAYRFAKWLEAIAGPVQVVEAGALDGTVAGDILEWLAANDEPLFARLRYVIAEPSAKRQSWQAKRLAKFDAQLEWRDSLAGAPEIRGVIFCNELLDAFPMNRIGGSRSMAAERLGGHCSPPGQVHYSTCCRISTPPSCRRKPTRGGALPPTSWLSGN